MERRRRKGGGFIGCRHEQHVFGHGKGTKTHTHTHKHTQTHTRARTQTHTHGRGFAQRHTYLALMEDVSEVVKG